MVFVDDQGDLEKIGPMIHDPSSVHHQQAGAPAKASSAKALRGAPFNRTEVEEVKLGGGEPM